MINVDDFKKNKKRRNKKAIGKAKYKNKSRRKMKNIFDFIK